MSRDEGVVIEIIGEGKTEGEPTKEPEVPSKGVLSILIHKLCGKPNEMRVHRRRFSHLQEEKGKGPSRKVREKGLSRKVRLAQQRAITRRSSGVVFVLDSEGNAEVRAKKIKELDDGRRMKSDLIPTAIGVAQPCIESWLLCDGPAIRRAMDLSRSPELPDEPESLPAPQDNQQHNAKTVLTAAGGAANQKKELSAAEKDRIAKALNDLQLLRDGCPLSFVPFADEVEREIKPLFVG